ncbi:MAG: hypothetical protein Q4B17_14925 [Lautropia sp.]|nr:hypothetical protein [Lautropia sp.]
MIKRLHVLPDAIIVSGGHQNGQAAGRMPVDDPDRLRWQKQCLCRFLTRLVFGHVSSATEARIRQASLADLTLWVQQLRLHSLPAKPSALRPLSCWIVK